jgi:hypothetical protein
MASLPSRRMASANGLAFGLTTMLSYDFVTVEVLAKRLGEACIQLSARHETTLPFAAAAPARRPASQVPYDHVE